MTDFGISLVSGGPLFPFVFPPQSPQTIVISGAGNTTPIQIIQDMTLINNSPIGGVTSAHAMSNGTFLSQIKTVRLDGNGSTVSSTITPATMVNGTSVTLVVDSTEHSAHVRFMWNGVVWTVIDVFNATINP